MFLNLRYLLVIYLLKKLKEHLSIKNHLRDNRLMMNILKVDLLVLRKKFLREKLMLLIHYLLILEQPRRQMREQLVLMVL
jgi:hypothetical protein